MDYSLAENADRVTDPVVRTSRGGPLPLGASVAADGVNFSLYSRDASAVTLVLFRAGEHAPIAEVPLDVRFNRTGDVWHVFVHGREAGLEYGYRVDGPIGPAHHFAPTRTLLDP